MRRVALFSSLMILASMAVAGCALSDEPAEKAQSLPQGLTVLAHSDSSISLAYREADVVIYMQANRGKATPELYQFDSNSPLYEIDARYMEAGGFVFHMQQGGHGFVDPSWAEPWNRQLDGEIKMVGSSELLFRMATAASATLYKDIEKQIGAEKAAQLAPELDSIFTYTSKAHDFYLEEHEARQRYLVEQGRETLPEPSEVPAEITYGTPGPDDTDYFLGNVTSAKIQLRADKLDGIPGYAGGYHSATKRYYWKSSTYYSQTSCNHGTCAGSLTYRSGSGYKDFTGSSYLRAYNCDGDYKWDSDGGYYGHNCHDDSRYQLYLYRYATYQNGKFRWCNGNDSSWDISVDILFVELDQSGYPSYSTSSTKGYGSL